MTDSPDCQSVQHSGAWGLFVALGAVLVLLFFTTGRTMADDLPPDAVDVIKVWDAAPYNGFTDLTEFGNELFLTFREGTSHSSVDGKIRVLVSWDGDTWKSAALLEEAGYDLRDPKFSVTPEGMLMLNAALRGVGPTRYQSVYWTSSDGREWSGPTSFGRVNYWLWRVAWKGPVGYSVGYRTIPPYHTTLFSGSLWQGIDFSPVISPLVSGSYANETVLLFRPSTDILALTRRDPVAPYTTSLALLGTATAPYTSWTWTETNYRLGGPDMLELPDGRIVVGARVYTPTAHTGLLWLNHRRSSLNEFLELPSGGDTGYPGIIVRDDELWVGYYSSHEGKACIYLAKRIPIPPDAVRVYVPAVLTNR